MISSIVFLIIVAIFIYLILKFIKKVVSMVISFAVLFILISSMFLFLVYTDYRDFKAGISEKESIILISDGPAYITGGYVNITSTNMLNTPKYIEDIGLISTQSYKDILGENYKLFIIDLSFYEQNLPEITNYNNYSLKKNGILNTLRSQNPNKEFAALVNKPVESITKKPNELKLELALGALDYLIKNQGKIITISGYKDKQIRVYKDTMLFKLIKIAPTAYINKYITN